MTMFPEITLQHGDVSLAVSPARGAHVTSLIVAGSQVFYMNRDTFNDPEKSVRGGIPILFPYAGRLVDELFLPKNTVGKIHGFARSMPWKIIDQAPAEIRLELLPSAETAAVYPYDWRLEMRLHVLPRGLHQELLVENFGDEPMPVSPGFHPYFCCPRDAKPEVRSDLAALDPARLANELMFDFGLPPASHGITRFHVPKLGTLRITASPEMRHLQFWSLPGSDFICLEPFSAIANTINTPQSDIVAPRSSRVFFERIELESTAMLPL